MGQRVGEVARRVTSGRCTSCAWRCGAASLECAEGDARRPRTSRPGPHRPPRRRAPWTRRAPRRSTPERDRTARPPPVAPAECNSECGGRCEPTKYRLQWHLSAGGQYTSRGGSHHVADEGARSCARTVARCYPYRCHLRSEGRLVHKFDADGGRILRHGAREHPDVLRVRGAPFLARDCHVARRVDASY